MIEFAPPQKATYSQHTVYMYTIHGKKKKRQYKMCSLINELNHVKISMSLYNSYLQLPAAVITP